MRQHCCNKTFTASLLVLLATTLPGCATQPSGNIPEKAAPSVKTEASPSVVAKRTTAALPTELSDPNHILSRRNVYFDRDQLEPRASDLALIQAHAQLLVNNRKLKVVVSGYTDARGSMEYNLAIGQKRAEAVRHLLISHGAHRDQVKARSMGTDDQARDNNSETIQAHSRRAEIRYQDEP